jgi:TPR repeat protein
MAMGLWSRAFELGRIDAGLRIAKLYKQGDGLPKDPSLALYWYEKAAQKGNQEAQANAGDMYYRGTGTNKDEVKALEYFQHCAISIPYCQSLWAIILEDGKAGKRHCEVAGVTARCCGKRRNQCTTLAGNCLL